MQSDPYENYLYCMSCKPSACNLCGSTTLVGRGAFFAGAGVGSCIQSSHVLSRIQRAVRHEGQTRVCINHESSYDALLPELARGLDTLVAPAELTLPANAAPKLDMPSA